VAEGPGGGCRGHGRNNGGEFPTDATFRARRCRPAE
jgi:hypothetical protein